MNKDRIVVTGIGTVTPFGIGVSSFWDKIIAGQSAVHKTANEELEQWAPVMASYDGFDPSAYLPKKQARALDRFAQMGLIAAIEALQDAGFSNSEALQQVYDKNNIGISIGSAYGGVQTLEEGSERIAKGISKRVSARLVPKSIPNACASAIAINYDIHGPAMTYSTACASSSNSIGEASYWLQLGKADMVIAGGAESLFSPAILSGLRAATALASTGPEDLGTWSRPFDKHRSGMVMGEGAAIVILERLEKAKERNAHIYAELVGYGTSNDAFHETTPNPAGSSAKLAMEHALKSAALKPEDIDYVNAHATATPVGDQAEAVALRSLFGDHLDQIPVSSIKGAVGHMLGTAGAIESVACIKAMETSQLPPTINCDDKDDNMPKDIVPNHTRTHDMTYTLSNSFGFGGQNSVLVWKKYMD
ncbi:3-oxoacyl-[acyl-carrier-protein] synthase 2 [Pullulanibacillus camelliae]|uniref:3-oxoacyl-[acyl-carrier-protein] synthase 2 n=1 Tax=Pullulanibacillus camelliae TaxID=1707096 RepID=A0A8J2YF26_9BACL|nr:beta-ketoacyl-[acyl-carrier-protein] synthase family protein [Pullulanibacillus camelliae]GGE40042.1 3-oxoacyl-[acyl-carrier-protein] synthase 2 [Pullulanibacillus camelliae]